jgi:hypothetical protein
MARRRPRGCSYSAKQDVVLMRVFPYRDDRPNVYWVETNLAVGEITRDAFGDKVKVVEIPDDLWDLYMEAKREIEEVIKGGQ